MKVKDGDKVTVELEGFEYKEFRFFVRLQEQGAQGRRKRQRVEPA